MSGMDYSLLRCLHRLRRLRGIVSAGDQYQRVDAQGDRTAGVRGREQGTVKARSTDSFCYTPGEGYFLQPSAVVRTLLADLG